MPAIVDSIKSKLSSSNSNSQSNSATGTKGGDTGSEPTFSIQPHPAQTNDPADLQPHGGLRSGSGGAAEAFHARDPYVPSEQIRKNMPPALSHEELQARSAELNK